MITSMAVALPTDPASIFALVLVAGAGVLLYRTGRSGKGDKKDKTS